MFKSTHTHTHTTTIVEKRAPTDESIRLADEMREKTLERILDSIPVKDNVFEGHLVQVAMDPVDWQYTLHALFKLNGRKYHTTTKIDEMLSITEPDLAKRRAIIAEHLAQVIAVELMKQLPEKD